MLLSLAPPDRRSADGRGHRRSPLRPPMGQEDSVMTRQHLAAALAAVLVTTLAGCNKPAPSAETPAGASTTAPAASATAAAAPTGGEAAAKPAPTDFDQLAKRVVANAGVKEGEVVLINGRPQDAELLEDLAVAARSVGAFPMVLHSSDRLSKRMFFDVPEKFDTQADVLDTKLAGIVNVVISLGNGMSENLFEGADRNAWPHAARRTKASRSCTSRTTCATSSSATT